MGRSYMIHPLQHFYSTKFSNSFPHHSIEFHFAQSTVESRLSQQLTWPLGPLTVTGAGTLTPDFWWAYSWLSNDVKLRAPRMQRPPLLGMKDLLPQQLGVAGSGAQLATPSGLKKTLLPWVTPLPGAATTKVSQSWTLSPNFCAIPNGHLSSEARGGAGCKPLLGCAQLNLSAHLCFCPFYSTDVVPSESHSVMSNSGL